MYLCTVYYLTILISCMLMYYYCIVDQNYGDFFNFMSICSFISLPSRTHSMSRVVPQHISTMTMFLLQTHFFLLKKADGLPDVFNLIDSQPPPPDLTNPLSGEDLQKPNEKTSIAKVSEEVVHMKVHLSGRDSHPKPVCKCKMQIGI